ncbi:MAG: hypothetical protein LBM13_02540 [Candidatus Ancillula sp.]|jgi:hypothetical protein|nr:hypothetical protein [Candidatus Ancillula sp.]
MESKQEERKIAWFMIWIIEIAAANFFKFDKKKAYEAPNDQYCYKTLRALKCLNFKKSYSL